MGFSDRWVVVTGGTAIQKTPPSLLNRILPRKPDMENDSMDVFFEMRPLWADGRRYGHARRVKGFEVQGWYRLTCVGILAIPPRLIDT